MENILKNPFSDYSAFDILKQLSESDALLIAQLESIKTTVNTLVDVINHNADIQESIKERLDHIENYLEGNENGDE